MLLEKYDIEAMQSRQEDERPLIVTTDNARKAIMTKLNRSGSTVSGSRAKRVVQRGGMARGNSFAGTRFGQRVVVKIRYVKHKKKFDMKPGAKAVPGLSAGAGGAGGGGGRASAGGGASVLRSHVNYISRGEAGKDGEQAVLFNAREEGVDKGAFVSLCADDRHHWRFIVSPENGHQIEDFQGYVRGIMGKVEGDLGTKLEWVSAVHYDTDDIHAHVIVQGKNDRGQDLVIGQDYIKEGVRRRAQELATELLGERSLEEVQKSLEAEVDALRVTSLDHFIQKQASKEHVVDVRKKQNFDKSLFYEGLIKGRLRYLASAGLAHEKPPGVFTLKEDYKETLAQVAQKNDVIRQLHKSGLNSELDGLSIYSMKARESQTVEGCVVAKGLTDEITDKQYLVVRDATEKHHYVPIGEFRGYDELSMGSLVRVVPGGQSSGKADHNIAREAKKNRGVYDPEKHRAVIAGYIPEADRPRYLEVHQIRLASLEKNGIVKALGEGRYEIPKDMVERGAEVTWEINMREDKRFYPKLEVLSAKPLSRLVEAEKKTWLDKELVLQAKGTPSLTAYDASTKQALEDRKAWLALRDMAVMQPDGEFTLREDALHRLNKLEVYAAGRKLAEKLELQFSDRLVRAGEPMVYEGHVTLETGLWAVASKGKSLHLAPLAEKPALERGTEVVFEPAEQGKMQIREHEHTRAPEKDKDRDQEMER